VGSRIVERRKITVARRRDSLALGIVLAAILGPVLLTGVLIAIDMRTDLSGLKARQGEREDIQPAIGWGDLANLTPARQLPVRMLGYMMEGYRSVNDGTPVMMFMLMPDAGHVLHPAHRVPDEMVEVWLPLDMPVRYSDRRLVWVSGTLRRKDAVLKEGEAMFTISNATVHGAAERQIRQWFVP
jgi:hypothetical protein